MSQRNIEWCGDGEPMLIDPRIYYGAHVSGLGLYKIVAFDQLTESMQEHIKKYNPHFLGCEREFALLKFLYPAKPHYDHTWLVARVWIDPKRWQLFLFARWTTPAQSIPPVESFVRDLDILLKGVMEKSLRACSRDYRRKSLMCLAITAVFPMLYIGGRMAGFTVPVRLMSYYHLMKYAGEIITVSATLLGVCCSWWLLFVKKPRALMILDSLRKRCTVPTNSVTPTLASKTTSPRPLRLAQYDDGEVKSSDLVARKVSG